jgi:hypothetical protein
LPTEGYRGFRVWVHFRVSPQIHVSYIPTTQRSDLYSRPLRFVQLLEGTRPLRYESLIQGLIQPSLLQLFSALHLRPHFVFSKLPGINSHSIPRLPRRLPGKHSQAFSTFACQILNVCLTSFAGYEFPLSRQSQNDGVGSIVFFLCCRFRVPYHQTLETGAMARQCSTETLKGIQGQGLGTGVGQGMGQGVEKGVGTVGGTRERSGSGVRMNWDDRGVGKTTQQQQQQLYFPHDDSYPPYPVSSVHSHPECSYPPDPTVSVISHPESSFPSHPAASINVPNVLSSPLVFSPKLVPSESVSQLFSSTHVLTILRNPAESLAFSSSGRFSFYAQVGPNPMSNLFPQTRTARRTTTTKTDMQNRRRQRTGQQWSCDNNSDSGHFPGPSQSIPSKLNIPSNPNPDSAPTATSTAVDPWVNGGDQWTGEPDFGNGQGIDQSSSAQLWSTLHERKPRLQHVHSDPQLASDPTDAPRPQHYLHATCAQLPVHASQNPLGQLAATSWQTHANDHHAQANAAALNAQRLHSNKNHNLHQTQPNVTYCRILNYPEIVPTSLKHAGESNSNFALLTHPSRQPALHFDINDKHANSEYTQHLPANFNQPAAQHPSSQHEFQHATASNFDSSQLAQANCCSNFTTLNSASTSCMFLPSSLTAESADPYSPPLERVNVFSPTVHNSAGAYNPWFTSVTLANSHGTHNSLHQSEPASSFVFDAMWSPGRDSFSFDHPLVSAALRSPVSASFQPNISRPNQCDLQLLLSKHDLCSFPDTVDARDQSAVLSNSHKSEVASNPNLSLHSVPTLSLESFVQQFSHAQSLPDYDSPNFNHPMFPTSVHSPVNAAGPVNSTVTGSVSLPLFNDSCRLPNLHKSSTYKNDHFCMRCFRYVVSCSPCFQAKHQSLPLVEHSEQANLQPTSVGTTSLQRIGHKVRSHLNMLLSTLPPAYHVELCEVCSHELTASSTLFCNTSQFRALVKPEPNSICPQRFALIDAASDSNSAKSSSLPSTHSIAEPCDHADSLCESDHFSDGDFDESCSVAADILQYFVIVVCPACQHEFEQEGSLNAALLVSFCFECPLCFLSWSQTEPADSWASSSHDFSQTSAPAGRLQPLGSQGQLGQNVCSSVCTCVLPVPVQPVQQQLAQQHCLNFPSEPIVTNCSTEPRQLAFSSVVSQIASQPPLLSHLPVSVDEASNGQFSSAGIPPSLAFAPETTVFINTSNMHASVTQAGPPHVPTYFELCTSEVDETSLSFSASSSTEPAESLIALWSPRAIIAQKLSESVFRCSDELQWYTDLEAAHSWKTPLCSQASPARSTTVCFQPCSSGHTPVVDQPARTAKATDTVESPTHLAFMHPAFALARVAQDVKTNMSAESTASSAHFELAESLSRSSTSSRTKPSRTAKEKSSRSCPAISLCSSKPALRQDVFMMTQGHTQWLGQIPEEEGDESDTEESEESDGWLPALKPAPLFESEMFGQGRVHDMFERDESNLFGPSPLTEVAAPPAETVPPHAARSANHACVQPPAAHYDKPNSWNKSNRVPRGWVGKHWLARSCCPVCGSRHHLDCSSHRQRPAGIAVPSLRWSGGDQTQPNRTVHPLSCTQHPSFVSLSNLVKRLPPGSQQSHLSLVRSGNHPKFSKTAIQDMHATYALGRWLFSQFGSGTYGGCILQRGGQSITIGECIAAHAFWWSTDSAVTQYYRYAQTDTIDCLEFCSHDTDVATLHIILIVEADSKQSAKQPSGSGLLGEPNPFSNPGIASSASESNPSLLQAARQFNA